MDTHIANHPDIEPGPAGLSARLPGERTQPSQMVDELEVGERLAASAPKRARRPRGKLLAGVAVVAVAIAGGAFLLSPYNTVYPVPRLQASVDSAANGAARTVQTTLRPILAPSASLAKVAVPSSTPATRDTYVPKPRDQEVAELLSIHPVLAGQGAAETAAGPRSDGRPTNAPAGQPAAKPAPAVAAVAADSDVPAGYIPREPGSIPVPQMPAVPASPPATPVTAPVTPAAAALKDATAAIIASLPRAETASHDTQAIAAPEPTPAPAAQPQAPEPAPASAIAAHALQPDVLAVATKLRASPMTQPEQVQVLNLVTEVAAMVKDLRRQQAQLRADMGRSSANVAARLTDYERRLALAEARNAVTAADDPTGNAPAKPVDPASDPAAATLRPIPVMTRQPVAVVPSPLVPSAPKVYRVQAASPGLALLAQVDRGGGDGAQMQVVVGDTVPDYGRVKSIAQKGTSWVVTTEHGLIQ